MSRKGKGSKFRRAKERQHVLAREQRVIALGGLPTPYFYEVGKEVVMPAYREFGNLLTTVAFHRKQPKNRAKRVPLIIAEELYKSRNARI